METFCFQWLQSVCHAAVAVHCHDNVDQHYSFQCDFSWVKGYLIHWKHVSHWAYAEPVFNTCWNTKSVKMKYCNNLCEFCSYFLSLKHVEEKVVAIMKLINLRQKHQYTDNDGLILLPSNFQSRVILSLETIFRS